MTKIRLCFSIIFLILMPHYSPMFYKPVFNFNESRNSTSNLTNYKVLIKQNENIILEQHFEGGILVYNKNNINKFIDSLVIFEIIEYEDIEILGNIVKI